MPEKTYSGPLRHVSMFSKKLPSTYVLLLILLTLSLLVGLVCVTLVNYRHITNLLHLIGSGFLAGILALVLPTLLTVITLKITRKYVGTKYLLFIALLGTIAYALFMITASAVYSITQIYSLSLGIIVVSAASLFCWWVFMNKILLNQKLRSAPLAVIQPILNMLFFIPASTFIFSLSTTITFLLVRLFSGIAVFLVVSYMIIYVIDAPIKKSLGVSGVDMFSQMIQDWLFKINIAFPARVDEKVFGRNVDIDARALIAKNRSNKIKMIMFIPDLHYGLSGLLGSSNFPYMLEKHGTTKYKAPTFVMHTAINEDYNAVSSDQYTAVRRTFDECIRNAKKAGDGMYYQKRTYKDAKINVLGFGETGIVTLTRAPKVTEDITYAANVIIKNTLEDKIKNPILIDAHNSRYESAPKSELENVDLGSDRLNEYLKAIGLITRPQHKSKKVNVGVSNIEIANALKKPSDLALGALNIAIFSFNGFRYGLLQFNANNMLPSFREEIIEHVKKKYKISVEVCTTDTHNVNSLRYTASNVLGKSTKLNKLFPLIDNGIESALSNIEEVNIYYYKDVIKNFKIWGANQREKVITAINSMVAVAKILIPVIIVLGFLVAALVISFV